MNSEVEGESTAAERGGGVVVNGIHTLVMLTNLETERISLFNKIPHALSYTRPFLRTAHSLRLKIIVSRDPPAPPFFV